jgi:uncharacterized protein YcgL (UPF0745 family)
MLCQVFKSPRKEQMYLFVAQQDGLESVPETLLATFGEPESVMMLELTPERKLARARAQDVLAAIAEQGFYLQMPPTEAELRAQHHGE